MSESDLPETKYARADGINLAYQVMGQGPIDILMVPGLASHVEYFHEMPNHTAFLRRLARFARVICFDKRGQGLSDRMDGFPTLEVRVDDMRAVLAAVGSERPVVFGYSEGATMSALYAATYPDRLTHLILFAGMARFAGNSDYPFMPTIETMLKGVRWWGTGASIKTFVPSCADDPAMVKAWARGERLSVSPGSFKQMLETNQSMDVRGVLDQIRAPTLVMQRRGDRAVMHANARYIAGAIPGARLIEYEGDDHFPNFGNWESVCDDVEEFITGTRSAAIEIDRVLATVLFTDIVDSTAQLTRLGDGKWRTLLDTYEAGARRAIAQHRGRFVKSTGDGVLATFDGPARAIRCAIEMRRLAAQSGLATRAGVHTGEVELRGEDVGGVAVHVAARIMAEAAAATIAVSRVVTDLVAGSGLTFTEPRLVPLKGLAGEWQIHGVIV